MAAGDIILSPTPRPARTVAELHQSVSVWTRQAERAFNQVREALKNTSDSSGLTELAATVAGLQTAVNGLSSEVTEITSDISGLDDRVTDLEAGGGGGGSFGNVDGGIPASNYGGIDPIDAGGVT